MVDNRSSDERYDRKTRVRELREQGYRAYEEGTSLQNCPERDMDAFQWQQGWLNAQDAHEGDGDDD